MKTNLIALALISAIVSSGAIAPLSLAQSVFYSNGGVDATILFDGAVSAPFQAEIWVAQTATKLANPCGLAIFSILPKPGETPRQSLFVNGQRIDYDSLPVQTIPVCSAGILSEPRTANFKSADGKAVLVGQTGSITAQYWGLRKRSTTFNACGFRTVGIKNAATLGADSIGVTFAGQTTAMGDLNQIQSLPICKKIGSTSIKYIKVP